MVKEKPNSTRTYDTDGFRLRAACVCVRDRSEREVLLVTGSRDPRTWIVPGGGIEPLEETRVAALREVHEEAGVKGKLDRFLGVFEFFQSEVRKTRTSVFVVADVELVDEWDDSKTFGRQRRWFPIDEAKMHLDSHRPAHRSYLDFLQSSISKPELIES